MGFTRPENSLVSGDLTTYQDLVYHVLDYVGGDVSPEASRRARRAVLSAYRDLAKDHRWRYYLLRGRVATVAQQTTGTVTYDHTGGTYERQITLTGATWPSWAALGTLRIGNVAYDIAERKIATVITLLESSNPGDDLADATAYSLYRDTYTLPYDFQEAGELILVSNTYYLRKVSPADWMNLQRTLVGPSTPCLYTFTGDPNTYGGMALRLHPAPDQAGEIDFLYKRTPRPLTVQEYSTGTATTTDGSTTVSGSGTSWTANLVGAAIRFAETGQGREAPTGKDGPAPFLVERVITAVNSTTSLTVDADPGITLAAVKYAISDVVDVEPTSMMTYLLRECEKQARLVNRMSTKDNPEELRELERAREAAWAADARSFAPQAEGSALRFPYRMANMPIDFN